MSLSRAASVNLFIAGRYFSTATVPGVFFSGASATVFFGLLTSEECILEGQASTGNQRKNNIGEHGKTSLKSADVSLLSF